MNSIPHFRRLSESHVRNVVTLIAVTVLFCFPGVAASQSAAEVYKKCLPSVMTLSMHDASGNVSIGTAFAAIEPGLAVTALHVIEGAKSGTAKLSNGSTADVVEIISVMPDADLALIRVSRLNIPLLEIAREKLPVGTTLFTIGAPEGLDFSITQGILSQVRKDSNNIGLLQVSLPVNRGNSGGPVLSEAGKVVGVISFGIRDTQGLNFAISSDHLEKLSENRKPVSLEARTSPASEGPETNPRPNVPAGMFFLQRAPRIGESTSFRLVADVEVMGLNATFTARMKEKVTKVDKQGNYAVESTQLDGKVKFGDQEMESPSDSPTITLYAQSGEVLEIFGDNLGVEAYRIANLSAVIFPADVLAKGAKHQYELKPSARNRNTGGKGQFEVIGFERIGDWDTVKIKFSFREQNNPEPAESSGFLWLLASDNSLVKFEGEYKNAPFPGTPGPINAKIKIERI